MRLELPDYVINPNLITAVQRNNVGYVKGVLRSCPWLCDALFYSESQVTSISLFEHTYNPPVFFLLTLIAYAVRYNSKKVISALRALNVDIYRPCYVADMLEESTVLEPCYRVLEMPPIALCQPTDPGVLSLIERGYDIHAPFTVTTSIYRGQDDVEEAVAEYRGYWEFCLGVSKRNHNSQGINELTKCVVLTGFDVNILLRQLDLCKLFARYYHLTTGKGFRNVDNILRAIDFIEILVHHGCCLTERPMVHNMYKALGEIIQSPNHTHQSRDRLFNLLHPVILLTSDINYLKKLEVPLIRHTLKTVRQDTLMARSLRCLRLLLSGRFFQRNVAKLHCSEEVKQLIIEGRKQNT